MKKNIKIRKKKYKINNKSIKEHLLEIHDINYIFIF